MRDYLLDLWDFSEKIEKSLLFFQKNIDDNNLDSLLDRESYTNEIQNIIKEYSIYIEEFENDENFSQKIKKEFGSEIYKQFKKKYSNVLADHKIIKEKFKKKIDTTEDSFIYGFGEDKKLSPNDTFAMGFDHTGNNFEIGFGSEPCFDYSDSYILSSKQLLDFLEQQVDNIGYILSTLI